MCEHCLANYYIVFCHKIKGSINLVPRVFFHVGENSPGENKPNEFTCQ